MVSFTSQRQRVLNCLVLSAKGNSESRNIGIGRLPPFSRLTSLQFRYCKVNNTFDVYPIIFTADTAHQHFKKVIRMYICVIPWNGKSRLKEMKTHNFGCVRFMHVQCTSTYIEMYKKIASHIYIVIHITQNC